MLVSELSLLTGDPSLLRTFSTGISRDLAVQLRAPARFSASAAEFSELLLLIETGSLASLRVARDVRAAQSLIATAEPLLLAPSAVLSVEEKHRLARADVAVRDLVGTVNSALSSSGESGSSLSEISRFVRDQSPRFSEVGITVDLFGKLRVDEAKLSAALDEDPFRVRDVLGGEAGLARFVTTRAEVFLSESLRFSGTTLTNASFVRAVAVEGLLVDVLA